MNPVPDNVTEIPPLPATNFAGEMLVIDGAGKFAAVTVSASAPLVPPPGAGLVTETGRLPPMSADAGTTTTSDVRLADAGAKPFGPTMIELDGENPFPLNVSVTLPLPATTLLGEMLVNIGIGRVT